METNNPQMLIGDAFVPGQGEWLQLTSPVTEAEVARLQGASPEQVDAAVKAAQQAFNDPQWQDGAFRREKLLRLAALMHEHRESLMDTLIQEIGTPMNLIANHVDTPAQFVRWFAEAAVADRTRHLGLNANATGVSTVAYRPVGVVGAITAFNYPLLLGVTKAAAALAAGCTMVLLSSPLAPLAVLQMGRLFREAGFPPGVINVLAGGAATGQALTSHAGVDKVSFTGSVNVGRQVMRQASEGLRDVVLELGGKSAAILLPGVDFERYAFSLHARYARNAGQGCGSPTRILVEESRYEEFVEVSRKVFPRITVGDPRDPATIVGPVITARQREQIEARVAAAVERGAEIVAGGGRPAIDKGWFLNPTLVGRLDNQDPLAREELFGPVSAVLTYRTVEEAIRITNDSDLGLKAYIFGDKQECLRIAAQLRVGTVQINGGSTLRPDAPMTGYKHSGLGSEWGEDGLREFLLPQHIDCAI